MPTLYCCLAETVVRLFTSLDDATFRAVLWDQAVHCLVWPPLVRYPGISETAKTDLRAYAAAGNNVVFLGNYVAVQFMNDVFGFQLTDDYQNGPYYRNDRNVRNTPFQFLPSRIEQASIETYAVKTQSLPPGGKSMLDTLGATVAFVVRYDRESRFPAHSKTESGAAASNFFSSADSPLDQLNVASC